MPNSFVKKINEVYRKSQNSYLSNNGLRPNEIYFLSCATKYKTDQTEFPQYWYYQMAIEEPRKLLDRLEETGFIEPASAAESLAGLKVPELKEILTGLNLPVSGKKTELISRICDNAPGEYLSSKMSARNYALTVLGKQELESNEYVEYFGQSQKFGYDIWSMNEKIHFTSLPFREIIRHKLSAELSEAISLEELDGKPQPFIYSQYGSFLLEDESTAGEAFEFFAKSAFYEIAADAVRSYRIALKDYLFGKDLAFPGFKDNCYFSIHSFKVIAEYLDIPPEEMYMELAEMFSKLRAPNVWNNVIIPENSISCEDLARIIVFSVQNDQKNLEAVYERVMQALLSCKLPVYSSTYSFLN